MENFNIEGFMEYIKQMYPEPMKFHFTYDLIQNLTIVLSEQFESPVQLSNLLHRIVPELTVEEVLQFCEK